jgi:outer membrane protein assembly factor BamB
VLAVGGRPGGTEGKMYALDAYSGEQLWTTPLSGGAMTTPIVADQVALVPIRVGRRYEFVGIDVTTGEELWRRACAGWADASALMALDNRFIINSAGGAIYAIGARDGKDRWTTVLGPVCSDDIPISLKVVLRGGMLFVPADTVYVVRPDNGHIIHSLGGEAPVPDLLQINPACSVFAAEDSGHIAMYNLSSQLRVVS